MEFMKIWCPNRAENWATGPSKAAKWIRRLVEWEIDPRSYSHK